MTGLMVFGAVTIPLLTWHAWALATGYWLYGDSEQVDEQLTGPKVPPPNPLLAATGSYIDRGDVEPAAGRRVTDEQLTEWARAAVEGSAGAESAHVVLLAGDLRESRAREAALVAELVRSSNRLFDAKAQATAYYERGLDFVREAELVAAERDEMRANWQTALQEDPAADERRLLGPARMVLDRAAEGVASREECAAMAQRIVDLIGHSVTDEPPHALVERDALRVERDGLQQRIDSAPAVATSAEQSADSNTPVDRMVHLMMDHIRAALTGRTQGGTDD